jgi:uncharacterized protein with NRDE domain
MSLVAIVYHLVPEAPILVACNREESASQVSPNPTIQSGKPRILASVDPKSGGTQLGVNQNGMFVAAIGRKKFAAPLAPRSRRILCRNLLRCNSARQAVDLALEELHSEQYNGVNYVIADHESGWVVHSGNDIHVVELSEGLSIVGVNDVDDRNDERARLAQRLLTLQMLDSPVKFLAVASKVFARPPQSGARANMVIRERDVATNSSTLISLGKKPRDAIFQFANGAPDLVKYEDYSPLLRDILSRGLREARSRAGA